MPHRTIVGPWTLNTIRRRLSLKNAYLTAVIEEQYRRMGEVDRIIARVDLELNSVN
jgi:hypothetical protein